MKFITKENIKLIKELGLALKEWKWLILPLLTLFGEIVGCVGYLLHLLLR